MTEGDSIKQGFIIYCDGIPGDTMSQGPGTFAMGVTKLEYTEETNTLMVHVRRPGLLIGRFGSNINAIEKYLECKIDITEINLLK